MVTILPEAFDRTELIATIKETKKFLDELLRATEENALKESILYDADKQLIKLRKQIKSELGLFLALKLP